MFDSGRMGTSVLETRGQTPWSCDDVEWSCQCSVMSASVWLILNDTVLCLPHHRFTLWTFSGLCTGTLVSGKTSFHLSQMECRQLCWASPLRCGRWVLNSMVFTHLEAGQRLPHHICLLPQGSVPTHDSGCRCSNLTSDGNMITLFHHLGLWLIKMKIQKYIWLIHADILWM